MASHRELRAGAAVSNLGDLVGGISIETDGENSSQRLGHNFRAARIVGVDENKTCGRYNIHQAAEAEFDLIEIGIDVSMVKLDVIDDYGLRKVMKEFSALVEKRGIVLVSFNNEIARITKSCALAQISGDSTNQETRVAARFAEEPSHECGRRRFPVRPRNNNIAFALEKKILQCLR